jgi:hypothetical protein
VNVRLHTVMKPATDVVASWPPAMNYLMMTSTTTQIACPTFAAWLLAMHMALRQPCILAFAVNRVIYAAHGCAGIIDETVTCV